MTIVRSDPVVVESDPDGIGGSPCNKSKKPEDFR